MDRFVADLVQQYFQDKKIVQEFTKLTTPEQNTLSIRSSEWFYHSIMERVICKRYKFLLKKGVVMKKTVPKNNKNYSF